MNVSVFGTAVELDGSRLDADPETVREQVRAYEAGDRSTFDLAIDYPENFTGEVMRAMERIPPGETRTYGALAAELDSAPIAIGQACGRNPLPVIVPCHRVVGVDSLTGYGGGLPLKRRLLDHEGASLPDEDPPTR